MSALPTPPPVREGQSPFELVAYLYLERGYTVIPIAPGTKRPGQWAADKGWRGMFDWERFFDRAPTEIELAHWYTWRGAGVGLLCGKRSRILALDRDYDCPGSDALERIIPYSPVKKKGAKGYTAFFRYNGERSCSFNIGGVRVLDVLSDGRQTLMPGTIHPDGHAYVYLTEDCLTDFDPDELPTLPDDFLEQCAKVIAPYQTDEDKLYQRKGAARSADSASPIDTDLSAGAAYYRDLNRLALEHIDAWATKIVPGVKVIGGRLRCQATWRGAKNHNVGIDPSGIRDFGGNYGMTAIDLVMHANGLTFQRAADALRPLLPMQEPEPIVFGSISAPTAAPEAPRPLPWMAPAAANAHPVMLPPTTSDEPARALPSFLLTPPGILGVIANWITATAPKAQPELSLAAAIALCSVVMGRRYRTQFDNWASLYVVMIAKSTEGKEHPQASVERVLVAAGLQHLIGGAGYTSSGAVFSALLKSPAHLAVVDELGKLLKLSRSKGQAHTEAALDKLVEAYGRCGGVMRPPTYSTMTVQKGAHTEVRVVHNPSITLLGATTPATFYDALTADLVSDGFLGRCLVVESHQPRQLTRFVERTDPPDQIIEWCKAVYALSNERSGNLSDLSAADMPANPMALPFDEACIPIKQRFEAELNDAKDHAEGDRLDVLLGRAVEKAMRLSMIVAKSVDSGARSISVEVLRWSIEYVRHYDLALVSAVRRERVNSETEGDIKRAVQFVRNVKRYSKDARFGAACAAGAMPHSKLLKLMGMSASKFREVIETAKATNVIEEQNSTYGFAGPVYFLVADLA